MSAPVPTEALAFLGAVASVLVILVIFFLYLNKLLCFSSCGGFPCMEAPPKKKAKNNLDDRLPNVPLGTSDAQNLEDVIDFIVSQNSYEQ